MPACLTVAARAADRSVADILAEAARRLGEERTYCPHAPHPKQAEFLALGCLEALYGGAAGGGKTDALLMAALQYVHVPGYAALLLRRTYADLALPGAIMDRAKAWLRPKGVHWDEKNKRFTFPSGATITFGYLDTDQDRFRYQGAELQFLGFDELTQFPEQWYRYLLSRLRRLQGASVPVRARAASNPGGIGHDWVRRRFIEALERGSGGVPDAGRQPTFVPATLDDNPHLDRTSYRQSLARLDPTTRKQLEEGIWIRDGSGLVYAHFDDHRNIIETAPENLTTKMLGLDFGIEDENAVAIVGWRDHDPCLYVLEAYRRKAIVSEMCREVVWLERTHKFAAIVGDTGGMGKGFTEEMRRRPPHIPVEPAEKHNKLGYISLMNAELAQGRIRLVRKACQQLIEEWRELPWNEARTKESDGFDNHASDACLYVWRKASAYAERPKEEKPKPGTAAAAQAMADRLEELATADENEEHWPQF